MSLSLVELWLTFLAALLASGHCIGMCGGMAAACSLGAGTKRPFWSRERLTPPLFYTLGRLGTYILLGGLTGWLGSLTLLQLRPSPLYGLPHLLAGGVMVWMGVQTMGLLPPAPASKEGSGLLTRLVRIASGDSRSHRALGLGVLTGLLPCSLHWAFQAKAFATGSTPGGMAILLAFGIGTLPAMWGFALLSSWLDSRARRLILRLAGLIIVLMGAMSLKRGIMILQM